MEKEYVSQYDYDDISENPTHDETIVCKSCGKTCYTSECNEYGVCMECQRKKFIYHPNSLSYGAAKSVIYSTPKTKWLRFYIYWRFPLSFLFSALSFLYYVPLFNEGNTYIYFVAFFSIIIYIYRIIVYNYIKHLLKIGYFLNLVLLACESILLIITNIFTTLFSLIWLITNVIYFKKREYMFAFSLKDNKIYKDTSKKKKKHLKSINNDNDKNEGFTINMDIYKPNSKNKIKLSQRKKTFIIILSFILAFVLLCNIIIKIGYNSAPKKAENLLAIYLSEVKLANNRTFLSFDEVYSVVSYSGVEYYVELSGTVNLSINGYKTIENSFSADVCIPIIGEGKISNISINGNKVK